MALGRCLIEEEGKLRAKTREERGRGEEKVESGEWAPVLVLWDVSDRKEAEHTSKKKFEFVDDFIRKKNKKLWKKLLYSYIFLLFIQVRRDDFSK